MTKVVVIKFKNGGKLYYFSPRQGEVYERNMPVVVETARGLEFAWVAYPEREVEDKEVVQPLKPIIRIATQRDKEFYAACEAKKPQAMQVCKEKIAKHGLEMKLIDCEYTFDGTKIVFYFTSAGRVDFRELVKDLASVFHIRIELRQVGTRDETKYLGGIAPCGRVCCCAGNMPEFKKVSFGKRKRGDDPFRKGREERRFSVLFIHHHWFNKRGDAGKATFPCVTLFLWKKGVKNFVFHV